jgi:hypothetical protein
MTQTLIHITEYSEHSRMGRNFIWNTFEDMYQPWVSTLMEDKSYVFSEIYGVRSSSHVLKTEFSNFRVVT